MSAKQAILGLGIGLALLPAACGETIEGPPVKGTVKQQVERFNRAIAKRSCRDYATAVATIARPPGTKPGAPPTPAECKAYAPLLARNLRGVNFTVAQPFHTAALAEGIGPAQRRDTVIAAVFVRDWDGRYRFFASTPAAPQIGTKPKHSSAFQTIAAAFVDAVRARDCKRVVRYLLPGGALALRTPNPQAACQEILASKNLAPQLAADGKAKPKKLGETRGFGFYGVATKKNYYTLIIATQQGGRAGRPHTDSTGIFDYVPNKRPVG